MKKKIAETVQWTSIVIGITGMSLDKLVSLHPSVSYTLTGISVIAFLTLVAIQVRHRDPNVFHGKKKVNLAWKALLTRADSSVEVFAGDVSWAQSNKENILARTKAGVEIRVLCRWPSTPILFSQAQALLDAGARVRYYSDGLVEVRGLVVDSKRDFDGGTALAVVKKPKHRIELDKGLSGTDSLFEYEARRYLPDQDRVYIAMLHQLFESFWESLPAGITLKRVALENNDLIGILARVPHYDHIGAKDVSIRKVSLSSLKSCCTTVKSTKLQRSVALLEAYGRFDLELFETCHLQGDDGRRLVLPPVVEQRADGEHVVIDGMHRIYALATRTDTQDVTCLVINNTSPLPSKPIPFSDVRASPVKVSRAENFPAYEHEHFRDMKIVDRHLAELAEKPNR